MESRLVLSSLLGVNDQYVDMSRQMLLYYSGWPITEFVLTLNGSESEIRSFRAFLRHVEIPATVFSAPVRYDNRLQARWSHQRQAYIKQRYAALDWKLCVDSDEILERSDAILELLQRTACAYFRGFTIDMLPMTSSDALASHTSVFARPHQMYLLTQAHALAQKVPLARANVLVGGAAHDVARRHRALPTYEHVLPLYHYKWESGVGERLRERFEHYHRLGLPYADESLQFCSLIEAGSEHLRVDDLDRLTLAIKRDKTGDESLQLDPAGQLRFFTASRWPRAGRCP